VTGPRHLRDVPEVDHEDPPLVLVPGIDGTALLFYRQQPLLARRFDTVAFPLPTAQPHAMTMSSLVDDLARLVEEVSHHGAILLGESFGGALALSTALARPDLVRGLVIVNSFPYFDERVKLALAPIVLQALPWAAMPIVRRYTSGHLHSPHTRAADIDEFQRCARAIDRDSYIRRLKILRSYDLRDDLPAIESPCLLLAGDRDRLVPSVRWARYMSDRIPQSEMEVLAGYGHVCLIDHDLDISRFVVPWWERVGADR